MRKLPFLALLIVSSCSHQKHQTKEAIVIKQWHTSPSTDTRDIDKSRGLPQYRNQKEIYEYLVNRIKTQKEILLIVEGCESGHAIDENFRLAFNGWDMPTLLKAAKEPGYDDIVTSLPMKLKAKYPKEVTALCADNEFLMKKGQFAISEARGFIGFYLRLKQSLSRPKMFSTYKTALEELQKKEISDPIEFSRSQTIKFMGDFTTSIQQRNSLFVQALRNHANRSPIIIVGGLHAKDLINQLTDQGIKSQLFTPQGYPESSEKLPEDLLSELEKQ